jgi:hypothetical protein
MFKGVAASNCLITGNASGLHSATCFQISPPSADHTSDPLILVAQGASRDFNPGLPQRVVDRALESDPAAAAAEYLGQWRTDVETFISAEVVDAAVIPNRFELPRVEGVPYVAFVDPSGGSSDDMTLAVAHREGETVVIDCVRAVKPPFSPDAVVSDFAGVLKSYGVSTVTGDRYGGEWPREAFRKKGVEYQCAPMPKSDLYRELLPLMNAGRVELLDHRKLAAQLIGLYQPSLIKTHAPNRVARWT